MTNSDHLDATKDNSQKHQSDQHSDQQAATLTLDFEAAYQQLEEIVERMERGEQELENSLADFEQGVALMKRCHSLLRDAEQKVDVLIKDNNGLFSTEPFED